MSTFERVIALLKTEELIQIEQAIKIIEFNNLFSPKGLAEVCKRRKTNNIIEDISNGFNYIGGNYYLYDSDLKVIPNEIRLFKNEITSLSIYLGKIESVPNSITELSNLVSLDIELTPLKSIPFDLRNLSKLKRLSIKYTKFPIEQKSKFLLPKECELIIEKSQYDDGFWKELNR